MDLTAAFVTLGCKVNQYETSAMSRSFMDAGFDIVDPESGADVYIVNSCTVTSSGDRKSLQAVRRLRKANRDAVICLTGCFPQAFPELAAKIPEADIISGSKNRAALPDLVKRRLENGEGRITEISPHKAGDVFEILLAPVREDAGDLDLHGRPDSRTRAFIKIEDGCEQFCAYCIVPKARGPVRSKSLGDIKAELTSFAAAGYKEAVLAGVNLSCYGKDIGLRLIDAVSLACLTDGIERVRLGSLEPELLSPGDIEAMAKLPKLCPHFHLSLQSGCDTTLARMRRRYTTAEYADIVKNLRGHFPGCAITTDIMVGFPGESEDEHRRSMEFVSGEGFAKAHVFVFSPRPGTAAADMGGQLGGEIKARRGKEMTQVTDGSRASFLASQTGRAEVLFETKEGGVWKGYTRNYAPVLARGEIAGQNLSGEIRGVSITGAEGDFCVGWLEG